MAQKRKRNKKWIYWLVMLVLLVAASVIVYFVWDNYFNDNKDDGVQGEETIQVDDKKKEDGDETEIEQGGEVIEKKKVEQYEGDDPNNALELSGAITFAQVVDSVLMVRINIDQYLDSGECVITIKNNGIVVHSSATSIVSNASTATCEGFDIETSGLGSGKVDLMIELDSGEKKGLISGEANV